MSNPAPFAFFHYSLDCSAISNCPEYLVWYDLWPPNSSNGTDALIFKKSSISLGDVLWPFIFHTRREVLIAYYSDISESSFSYLALSISRWAISLLKRLWPCWFYVQRLCWLLHPTTLYYRGKQAKRRIILFVSPHYLPGLSLLLSLLFACILSSWRWSSGLLGAFLWLSLGL